MSADRNWRADALRAERRTMIAYEQEFGRCAECGEVLDNHEICQHYGAEQTDYVEDREGIEE